MWLRVSPRGYQSKYYLSISKLSFLVGKTWCRFGRLYFLFCIMGFRNDRLREAMRLKGWDPADLHRETGIAYPQIARYRKDKGSPGSGAPGAEALAKIVKVLELDANYLLETDSRYDYMELPRALATMAFERYRAEQEQQGQPISAEEFEALSHVAHRHSAPPLWAAEWKRQHETAKLAAFSVATPATPRRAPQRTTRRARRLAH